MVITRSIALSSFLLAAQLLAQTAVNRTDANGLKQGPWSKTWPSTGKLRYEGSFVNDRPTGTFRHWDEDGRLTSEQRYAADGQTSWAVHYHPNGVRMAEGKYGGQQKDSTWTYFDVNGQLRTMEQWANGALNGASEAYFPDGKIAERGNYQAGQRHGLVEQFFANGQLRSTGNYVLGEPEGVHTAYYAKGNKEIEGAYVNGVRDGSWYYYHQDGSLQLQVLYAQGVFVKDKKENGVFKDYYPDEQLKAEHAYVQGKRNGAFTQWYNNGKWVERTAPADPNLNLPSERVRELIGQSKEREGSYRDDVLHGTVKEYAENGKLLRELMYENGELINTTGTK
jgi:antitoxin component YwqK of YwqJK toxin-antitoxin module